MPHASTEKTWKEKTSCSPTYPGLTGKWVWHHFHQKAGHVNSGNHAMTTTLGSATRIYSTVKQIIPRSMKWLYSLDMVPPNIRSPVPLHQVSSNAIGIELYWRTTLTTKWTVSYNEAVNFWFVVPLCAPTRSLVEPLKTVWRSSDRCLVVTTTTLGSVVIMSTPVHTPTGYCLEMTQWSLMVLALQRDRQHKEGLLQACC